MNAELIEGIETMLAEGEQPEVNPDDAIEEMTRAIASMDALLADVHRMRYPTEDETGRELFERLCAAWDIIDRLEPIYVELHHLTDAIRGQAQRCNRALGSLTELYGLAYEAQLTKRGGDSNMFDDNIFL